MTHPPDFFIVGQPKCGTTALHAMLSQHPGISMSQPKEPEFFASDIWRGTTAEEYRRAFDGREGRISGEASPNYLFSSVAAGDISQWNGSAKIIAILREPVDFLYSYYLQLRRNPAGFDEPAASFARGLELEDQRRQNPKLMAGHHAPRRLLYSQRVRYREQLERYYRHFAPEQVLVLIYDDFKADNPETLRRVCRFLGVDETFDFELADRNRGAKLRSKPLQQAIHGLSHGQGAWQPVKAAAKAVLPARATRHAIDWTYRHLAFTPTGEVAPELRRQLMCRFKPEVEAISELLDRDLVALWRYDRLA